MSDQVWNKIHWDKIVERAKDDLECSVNLSRSMGVVWAQERIAELETSQRWIPVSEGLPDVPANDYEQFIICVRRKTGKTYSFAAEYLNAKLVFTDRPDEPEDGTPFTGWYTQTRDDTDYDSAFEAVCLEGDEVTHWMPLPPPPPDEQGE